MRFKDLLLAEKFMTAKDTPLGYMELFTNPSRIELWDIMRNNPFGTIRFGVTDSPKPKVYAWDGSMIHKTAKAVFKIQFDVGLEYNKQAKGKLGVFGMDYPEWLEVNNPKAIIEVVTKRFPRIRQVDFIDRTVPVEKAMKGEWKGLQVAGERHGKGLVENGDKSDVLVASDQTNIPHTSTSKN